MLEHSLSNAADWLGFVPHDPFLSVPERYLGLVCADELNDPLGRIDRAADALAATRLGTIALSHLDTWQVSFPAPATSEPSTRALAGRTIAVARDAAFCFIYDANLAALQELGATLVFISPLVDSSPTPMRRYLVAGRVSRTARCNSRDEHKLSRQPTRARRL